MQRSYEVMFIVRPDMADEDVDKLISGLESTVTTGGGSVTSVEKMGRRRLAYTVRKFQDGNYILMVLEAGGTLVAEVERRLRVTEPVIKFITVRTDEDEKKHRKMQSLRDSRKKLSAATEAPAAAEPAAEVEQEPATATA